MNTFLKMCADLEEQTSAVFVSCLGFPVSPSSRLVSVTWNAKSQPQWAQLLLLISMVSQFLLPDLGTCRIFFLCHVVVARNCYVHNDCLSCRLIRNRPILIYSDGGDWLLLLSSESRHRETAFARVCYLVYMPWSCRSFFLPF